MIIRSGLLKLVKGNGNKPYSECLKDCSGKAFGRLPFFNEHSQKSQKYSTSKDWQKCLRPWLAIHRHVKHTHANNIKQGIFSNFWWWLYISEIFEIFSFGQFKNDRFTSGYFIQSNYDFQSQIWTSDGEIMKPSYWSNYSEIHQLKKEAVPFTHVSSFVRLDFLENE